MANTVTIDQMKGKLLTLDQAFERLGKTEPLETVPITTTSKVAFDLTDDFTSELIALGPTDVTQAVMEINGEEHFMTRDAALQACSNIGLPMAYVKKTPANLIQQHLNYHYSHGVDGKELNAMVVKGNLAAFSSAKIKPFSNIALLNEAIGTMQERFGKDADILVDYKFDNSLLDTNVRLIAASAPHTIIGTGMADIPSGGSDVWYPGVTLHNSLAGKSMTAFETYLFRFWCTNGAISTLDAVGTWNRRLNGQNEEEAYEWARTSVDEILGGMEEQFSRVQALTQLNLGSATADVLKQIFSEWEIPVSQRDAIRELLLGAETLTLYTVMQAITRVANDSDLSAARRDRLMRIGGSLPTRHYDSMKAKIWREGHEATEDTNPYELVLGQ